jgi:shikimate dehydrogenase
MIGRTTGHARLYGLIGRPVSHSLSPAMHEAAFHAQGMNCRYHAFHVEPEALPAAVAGLKALGVAGFNVTIPHKEAIMPLLDEVAENARLVGAVNTVVCRNGRLVGYNTDGWGFLCALEEEGVRPSGMRAVVLGAGGAARAIASHLILAGAAHVAVLNRTVAKAEALVASLTEALQEGRSAPRHLPPFVAGGLDAEALIRQADLVVNCTALGMGELAAESPLPAISWLRTGAVVYDTVYRPAQTRLMREALAHGCRAIGGLGMLVHQGACAWEYWFGRRGPTATMWAAVRAELNEG